MSNVCSAVHAARPLLAGQVCYIVPLGVDAACIPLAHYTEWLLVLVSNHQCSQARPIGYAVPSTLLMLYMSANGFASINLANV